jgi:hypothetical protein
MRKDENGQPCPETLGEYHDYCVALFGEDSKATRFIEGKIKSNPGGRDEKMIAPDSQTRSLLFSLATR